MNRSEGGLCQDNEEKPHVYVIRIDLCDGTALHPVMVHQSGPDWQRHLEEAVEYFANLYRGKGVVHIDYARNVYHAGVNDVENIMEWADFKRRHCSSVQRPQ